ncbi:MAG: hypothetical protein C4554_02355 [Dethiobacter sp.]|nr:MAG: hypothetical protein C4554_02355 [Dethiobacter sp.]
MRYHYHTGTMTRRCNGLESFKPAETLKINREDALAFGIKMGDRVRVTSRRGSVTTVAEPGETVPRGVVFLTFHYRETPANVCAPEQIKNRCSF